jgi:SAM-dependent methyltransferase
MPGMTTVVEQMMLRFRRRRMSLFLRLFPISAQTRVLDVGGTPFNWTLIPVRPRLTILNMPRARDEISGCDWVAGDGRQLPFPDRAFDIVFSNSVIEHLRDPESQQAFAREASRVGRNYFVQTPDRLFPVETHLLTPFIHFLPRKWQKPLVRMSVWRMITRPAPDRRDFYLEHYLRDVRLLGDGEMRGLFPDGTVLRERFLGIPKSLIAVRRDSL